MTVQSTSKLTAREVIDRIMADERFRASSHFSSTVYADEPILKTARQMATFLPDRYREMRAISRWESGADGHPGRWLTEAELFYRQGAFMADFEDDCPYHGDFRSYFPTYNAMSDHQLRGYFTWRTAIRRGQIEQAPLSFAFVYLYELLNGIGVPNPLDGFHSFVSFWHTYRVYAPELDRYARTWLQDYVIYHGLDAKLLEPYTDTAHDNAIVALRELESELEALPMPRGAKSALPLPGDTEFEERLFNALDEVSSYRMSGSRLMRTQRQALCHICCSVWARLRRHYARQSKHGAIESLFGNEVTLPYSMFGSAVFFEASPHSDITYALNPIHRYSCSRGRWSVTRFSDHTSRSAKLGHAMRAADRSLREALKLPYPLKDNGKTPRYVQEIVDREVAAWIAWKEAHAARVIHIDRTQLAGIRLSAMTTREALLIDEEREGAGELLDHALNEAAEQTLASVSSAHKAATPSSMADGNRKITTPPPTLNGGNGTTASLLAPDDACKSMTKCDMQTGGGEWKRDGAPQPEPTQAETINGSDDTPQPGIPTEGVPTKAPGTVRAWLQALLAGDRDAMRVAAERYEGSEDMLVDVLNETCFEQLGDTAIEYGENGPALIEDYRDDVEGMLAHGAI